MSRLAVLVVLLSVLVLGQVDLLIRAGRQLDDDDYAGTLATLDEVQKQCSAGSVECAEADLLRSNVMLQLGRQAEGMALSRAALAGFVKLYGEQHRSVARALANIGTSYVIATQYAEARRFFEKAIATWQDSKGPEDSTFASILNQYAFDLQSLGDYSAGKTNAERALAILEAHGGDRAPGMGQVQRTLGGILTSLGDTSGARRANDRALAVFEKRYGPDSTVVADLLVSQANLLRENREYSKAAEADARASRIYEKHLGPRNTRTAGALDNLAQDQIQLGQLAEARKNLTRAIDIQKGALGARSAWVANLIQGLAKVAAAEGNYAEARRLYGENLDIWREQLGNTHPFTLASLTQLTDVLAHLGLRQDAFAMALDTARIRRDHIAMTVRTVEERQALHYASLRSTTLDTAITIALDAGRSERRDTWDAVMRSRTLVLDEMSARHRAVRSSNNSEILALAGAVSDARAELARMVVQGKGRLSSGEYDRQVEIARTAVERAEEAVALRSVPFRIAVEREHAGFDDVRAALPAGAALVAYVRFQRKDFSRVGEVKEPSYAAFVIRAGESSPRLIALGPAARIEATVRGWRAEIDRERGSMGRSVVKNELSYREAGSALRVAVWDPIKAAVAGSRMVFIVPDGALQVVNFASLPVVGNRYLGESGPLLHMLPAERDLQAPAAKSLEARLMAVGDPAFASRDSGERAALRGDRKNCEGFSRTRFERLPGSAVEIRTISDIWKRQGGVVQILSGAAATESAVKERASGNRVVHLATHGFFLEDCGDPVAMENPLLRSGLALAGANNRNTATATHEDGILTAEEVASLNLDGTEWVVLSGCDTGLGEIHVGEGVLGLRRAFQEAGAATVITSLWPVDDEEARQWMESLYTNRFIKKQATAEAVRSANLRTLAHLRAAKKSTHPFHWASFVAAGDWR